MAISVDSLLSNKIVKIAILVMALLFLYSTVRRFI